MSRYARPLSFAATQAEAKASGLPFWIKISMVGPVVVYGRRDQSPEGLDPAAVVAVQGDLFAQAGDVSP